MTTKKTKEQFFEEIIKDYSIRNFSEPILYIVCPNNYPLFCVILKNKEEVILTSLPRVWKPLEQNYNMTYYETQNFLKNMFTKYFNFKTPYPKLESYGH